MRVWSELEVEERAAAEFLGYSEASWDACLPKPKDKPWAELSEAERAAAVTLGWTDEDSWGDQALIRPATATQTEWAALGAADRSAARLLGYTQEAWDPPPKGKDKNWEEMGESEREAASRDLNP